MSGWQDHLLDAFIEFNVRCRKADKAHKENRESEYRDYYWKFQTLTRSSSDEGITIQRRHEFFLDEMLKLLSPHLTKKDPKRNFGIIDCEIIYSRDDKLCQWCKMQGKRHTVLWYEKEIHHINPHRMGGKTEIDNGALMHRVCHPKASLAEEQFREWWENPRVRLHGEAEDSSDYTRTRKPIRGRDIKDLPDGIKCSFIYNDRKFLGKITEGRVRLEGVPGEFTSFSAASKAVTGTSRNGWQDWQLYFPEEGKWTLADDWRRSFSL